MGLQSRKTEAGRRLLGFLAFPPGLSGLCSASPSLLRCHLFGPRFAAFEPSRVPQGNR